MNTSIDIQKNFRHNFKPCLKAGKAARRIQFVEGKEAMSNRTAPNSFKCFKGCDLSLKTKTRSGRPSIVDHDALKSTVEENPTMSHQRLSKELGSTKDNTCVALYKLLKA